MEDNKNILDAEEVSQVSGGVEYKDHFIYTVVYPNERLSDIARFYGTTEQVLITLNNLTSTNLYPGQTLFIPKKR